MNKKEQASNHKKSHNNNFNDVKEIEEEEVEKRLDLNEIESELFSSTSHNKNNYAHNIYTLRGSSLLLSFTRGNYCFEKTVIIKTLLIK